MIKNKAQQNLKCGGIKKVTEEPAKYLSKRRHQKNLLPFASF